MKPNSLPPTFLENGIDFRLDCGRFCVHPVLVRTAQSPGVSSKAVRGLHESERRCQPRTTIPKVQPPPGRCGQSPGLDECQQASLRPTACRARHPFPHSRQCVGRKSTGFFVRAFNQPSNVRQHGNSKGRTLPSASIMASSSSRSKGALMIGYQSILIVPKLQLQRKR